MLNHKHLAFVAVIIAVVFLTIIVIHPRIFNPQNIGPNTGPAPVTAPGTAAHVK